MTEKEELERLEYRYLHTRASRAAVRKRPAEKSEREEPKESKESKDKDEEKPEVHVHVTLPEVKDAPKCETPRKWKFTHRYDQYNKLIETTATAE